MCRLPEGRRWLGAVGEGGARPRSDEGRGGGLPCEARGSGVVPVTLRLDRLHLTPQAAFGWTNSHLFEFLASEGRWDIPDPDGDFGPQADRCP
nr:hypothetical protein [Bradyrhizobium pachyrhizi]